MISVFQSWTSIGTLIGTVIDNATHALPGRPSYLIPLGVIYVVPALMSVGLFFIPESPRWLALMDRDEMALKSLLWMRPQDGDITEEFEEIRAAIKVEKESKNAAAWMDLWRDPVDRRRTLLAVAAISIQAASGAMFIIGT
jgi:MFS transporter, SP family, sugar:H+ symporter